MEIRPNLLDWNVNELERKLELEDMKHTYMVSAKMGDHFPSPCPKVPRALSLSHDIFSQNFEFIVHYSVQYISFQICMHFI